MLVIWFYERNTFTMTRNLLFAAALALPLLCAAQTDCLNEAEIAITTEMWGEEISWHIYDANGVVVASGSDYESNSNYVSTVCFTDSCYTLELVDSFGDGWNGGTISVNFAALGIMIGPLSIPTGSYASFAVGYGSECNGVPLDSTGGGGNNDVWGCMDPAALNFDTTATENCCCEYPVDCSTSNTLTIVQPMDSGAFGFGFVDIIIADSQGNHWYPSFSAMDDEGQWIMEGCIADGCYNLTMYNNTIAGTNNAAIIMVNGEMQETYTLGADVYIVNDGLGINEDGCVFNVFGCTDPEAPNYNADATSDDGSCLEPCDCPEVYDPVCGYDYYSGTTLTFDNLCELECAGAYLQWEGDCNTPPVYGCMDSEALNFDANATADSGWCLYMPECDGTSFVTMTSAGTTVDSLTGNVFGGASGYFEGANGPVNDFIQWYDDAGNTTSYGCLEDGCYNFYVYGGWNNGSAVEVSVDGGDPITYVLGADEFQAVFAVGINTEDCEVFIAGCTDSEASNYNPNATEDNGSCIYPFSCEDDQIAGQLYVCTFSQGGEVSLTIVDSQGDVLYSQDGYPDLTIDYIDVCLDPEECYTAIMSNNAGGDSWNGGYFWLQTGSDEWVNGSLQGATSDSIEFGMADDCGDDISGDVWGCTDPAALNYDPLATIDDGSCQYDTVDSLDCGDDNLVAGIFLGSDPWFNEVSWAILDSAGNSVLIGDGGNGNAAGFSQSCLPDGCYTLELYDSFGDGWGGGLLIVTTGPEALTFALEESDFASYPLEIGAGCAGDVLTIWGCMDPDAMNFDPNANAEDDSCEYSDGGPNNPGMSGWDTTVDFSIYPTPTGEIVNVLGDGFDNESPVVVRIKDMMGKLIAERTVNPAEGPGAWIFDVRNWPAGIYTAEGMQGNKVATGKILVAR